MEEGSVAFGIIIGLLFVSLVILFCVLIIKLYIHKVASYTKTLYEKDLAFQQTLTEAILETQEHVLNNISQELHDDAGQQLTYINFMVENLKLDSRELDLPLQQLSESLTTLSNSVRRISHSLNGQMLVQQDMVRAIQNEAERLKYIKGLKVVFKSDANEIQNLESGKQIVIYRIFQETINNVLKHAGASELSIGIKSQPVFTLTVTDNGKGFNYHAVKQSGIGMGLPTLESRAALVGLSVNILSSEGSGTTIILTENLNTKAYAKSYPWAGR